MKICIYTMGGKKTTALVTRLEELKKSMNVDFEILLISDLEEIIKSGIKKLPAITLDKKSGTIEMHKSIKKLVKSYLKSAS